jgi:hypothetical protein
MTNRQAALLDSQYRAGAAAGWNAQFADDPDAAIAALTRYEPGALKALADSAACAFCGDTGWVDDQNWSPDYADLPQERVPGNGKIRCMGCGSDGETKPWA